jgi:hypothetical protein
MSDNKGWTPEEEAVISKYVAAGQTRSNAIRKMRGEQIRGTHALGSNPVKVVPVKVAKPAKAKPEPKAPISRKGGKYDKDKVIELFMEGGKTVREIAASKLPGVVGISPVFAHRILFGSENSGGVSKDQLVRRKEAVARKKAWANKEVVKG